MVCIGMGSKSLNFLDKFDLKYKKLSVIVDKNFLAEVAKRKVHTFISTGMSTYENIAEAVEIFKKIIVATYAVSVYPLNVKDVNLETIKGLKQEFNCNVGYSGHENGIMVSIGAIMYGISSLEAYNT